MKRNVFLAVVVWGRLTTAKGVKDYPHLAPVMAGMNPEELEDYLSLLARMEWDLQGNPDYPEPEYRYYDPECEVWTKDRSYPTMDNEPTCRERCLRMRDFSSCNEKMQRTLDTSVADCECLMRGESVGISKDPTRLPGCHREIAGTTVSFNDVKRQPIGCDAPRQDDHYTSWASRVCVCGVELRKPNLQILK